MERVISYSFVILWIILFIFWRVPLRFRAWFFMVNLLLLATWKYLYEHFYPLHWWFFWIASFIYLSVAFWITDRERGAIKPHEGERPVRS